MDYLLKGDPISMIRLQRLFADACALHGVPLTDDQKTGVLTTFIVQAKKAGLLSDAPAGGKKS